MARVALSPVHATVTEIEGSHVELRIDGVLDPSGQPPWYKEGALIGGTRDGCGTFPVLAGGTRTLAFYFQSTPDVAFCSELSACIDRECGGMPIDDADYEARAEEYDPCATACQSLEAETCAAFYAEERLNGRVALAVETAEGWNFGQVGEDHDAVIGFDELDLLGDRDACDTRFPPDDTPCVDVIWERSWPW